ncbi:MAG TPA: MerR family transcriptional regulator [Vicinamibacteria bacterium]|nr:MerR family transcriptional regulator [Vicinamibacteria bacterium]
MRVESYRVKELARLAGVTVRTLHHYDRIGLLVPSARSDAGYRLYGEADLYRLQHILVWRELGFSLEQIRRMLDEPGFDRRKALVTQRQELLRRGRRVTAMIRSVELALEELEGGQKMDVKQLFDGFDPAEHEEEARERWGDTQAYREAARRTREYTENDWARIKAEGDALLQEVAGKMATGAAPDDPDVLELAERHRLQIDRWFYPCDRIAHRGLADLYLADERFESRIDRHAHGLTQFLSAAIRANAERG